MNRKEKEYSDEELLEILISAYNKNPNIKTKDFQVKNNLPRYSIYLERFGSWFHAKELAKIPNKQKQLLKNDKNNKDVLKNIFLELVNEIGYIPNYTELESIKNFPNPSNIYKYFSNYYSFLEYCGYKTNKISGTKYKKDFLIEEIKRFVKEFNRVPIQSDFERLEGYPSRKTFTNNFDNFNQVVRLAGYEPVNLNMKEKKIRYSKKYLMDIINNYKIKYNKVPTMVALNKEVGYEVKHYFKETFGSYNNALEEMGLKINFTTHYDDNFLEAEFHRFVKENGRIPVIAEFNNSEYPSFWCYQNRFGSWNKAVIGYGYEPNDANRKFILDNGEICASRYEFDISTWLQSKHIKYDRDINYKDFIDNYKGKMNCDYKIYYNNEIWYVEMAGFLSGINFNKFSDVEKNYFFKLKYKRKLLKRQEVKYIIIEPCDLKEKTLEEIFSVIFDKN